MLKSLHCNWNRKVLIFRTDSKQPYKIKPVIGIDFFSDNEITPLGVYILSFNINNRKISALR